MAIIATQKKMSPRAEHDHYRTDPRLVSAALNLLPSLKGPRMRIIDPGSGTGVWGKEMRKRWKSSYIIGFDPFFPKSKEGGIYNEWRRSNYEDYDSFQSVRLVAGNPPFSLAEEFVRTSIPLLRDGGYLLFLLRLAFLESAKRCNGLWQEFRPQSVSVLKQRVSFYDNGRTDDTAYAIYIWRKNDYPANPKLDWLSWR